MLFVTQKVALTAALHVGVHSVRLATTLEGLNYRLVGVLRAEILRWWHTYLTVEYRITGASQIRARTGYAVVILPAASAWDDEEAIVFLTLFGRWRSVRSVSYAYFVGDDESLRWRVQERSGWVLLSQRIGVVIESRNFGILGRAAEVGGIDALSSVEDPVVGAGESDQLVAV